MGRFKDELNWIMERDPACRNLFEAYMFNSGFHAIRSYRRAHKLYLKQRFFLARMISQLSRFWTGVEIHPGATIGEFLFIDHGCGIVIGETAEIGDHCMLYQGVTLGGTGKDVGKRHPTLGHGVLVGAGAKVLGPVSIGDGAKIAAGAVVLTDIPAHATAVGVPARVARLGGVRVEDDISALDHARITDPVSQELCRLAGRIEQLTKRLNELEGAPEPPDEGDGTL